MFAFKKGVIVCISALLLAILAEGVEVSRMQAVQRDTRCNRGHEYKSSLSQNNHTCQGGNHSGKKALKGCHYILSLCRSLAQSENWQDTIVKIAAVIGEETKAQEYIAAYNTKLKTLAAKMTQTGEKGKTAIFI